jgi:type II secretory pathway pseudopilin PulG
MIVVATLAAILMPSVNGYIEQARQARAREDVFAIAEGINAFITDTAEHQFLYAHTRTLIGNPSLHADTYRVDLLVGDGDIPPYSSALGALENFWTQAINSSTVDTLSNHLIENEPLEDSSERYRTPSDIVVGAPGGNNIDFARSSSSGFNAPYAWRGPYVRGPVDPDPWGNRYAVNVAMLDPQVTVQPPNTQALAAVADYSRMDVFVLSAGPDEEIDTAATQDGAVPGDDDLIHLVSSHAK